MNEIVDATLEAGTNAPFENLNAMTAHELVNRVAELLQVESLEAVKDEMEAIKVAFYKLHRAEWEAVHRAFVEGGGREEDFVAPEDVEELRFKELYAIFRKRRSDWAATQEKQREANLVTKLQIIEDIKSLINSEESMGSTFATFRNLQQLWRETGSVPAAKNNEVWESYNHQVENFYDYVKINRELRDLDLKHNLETKTTLAEEAEKLIDEPSVLNAFRRLQELHEQWRETGPVAAEHKEPLWERFKVASTAVNKRHQEHFEGIKNEQRHNLEQKEAICEKAEKLAVGGFATMKEWDNASEQIIELQKLWKSIGYASQKENARIYERFRRAADVFFEQKRAFYEGFKDELDKNLELKKELVAKAEALKDSQEWKKASDELIALQKQWKEVGVVRRSQSDAVWKQFRAACDAFFERKSAHFASHDQDQKANLEAKQNLIAEIESAEADGLFDTIKAFQTRWNDIGHVPIKMKDELQKRYKTALDRLFAVMRSGEKGRKIDNFRERVSSMKADGQGRLRSEREKLYNKVRMLENEIATLENNIGFFANSKGAEKLVADVKAKIEKAKADMAEAIEKVKVIDEN